MSILPSAPIPPRRTCSPFTVLAAVTLLTGIGAGFGGMLLALLHAIQHLAFGYSVAHVISHESFLDGVSAASAFLASSMRPPDA